MIQAMTSQPPTPTAQQRVRLRERLGRLVDVVDTDILMWEAVKEPRRPQAQVPLEFRTVDRAALDELRGTVPDGLHREAGAFLERGDTGFAALAGDAFAGWVWLSRRSHRDPWSGLRICLAPDEAYAYALWVEPDLRPKGVARALMTRMLHEVFADPVLTRVYGWVDKRNRESQMLLRLLGFKDVQHVKRAMVLDRLGRQIPGTDRPRFGPLSRDGRHRSALQNDPAATDMEHR